MSIGEKQCFRSVEFFYPWGITCDSSGNVYVADSAEHHVQVFTASKGSWPVSVDIGASGEVFVSELDNPCSPKKAGLCHHSYGMEPLL